MKKLIKLHIGGNEAKEGWEILNTVGKDNVDYIGDIRNLSQFESESCSVIYGSHVLEHVSQREMLPTLNGIKRLLIPGGKLMISVPDMEILCKLFVHPNMNIKGKFHVMRMMFGGQIDSFDFHYIGLNFDMICYYLSKSGFVRITRVKDFGIFNDTITYAPFGVPISHNVICYK